ncbi:exodeoxyribonuclease VII small subunit [Candidatus Avelusimicrobium facis]|uniref:exodeoxyribonuclease VII small subunit n=1 Tax=Candidatus Avelusimicrobium facis TaxID=3416203 RepID=UPI003D10AAD3
MKNGFESKLSRLEEIVAKLEEEQTDLDASVKLFEEGLALSKEMTQKLQEVKFKVTALKKKGAQLLSEPFDAPAGSADETDEADGR